MTKTLIYGALSALLLLAASCKKDDDAGYKLQETCSPTAKTVKTITDAVGIVYFDQTLQQYQISVHEPGTVDVVAVGVVCGTLPATLQADGTKVLVSGTFKEYGQPVAAPVGYTYYYLEVANIRLQ